MESCTNCVGIALHSFRKAAIGSIVAARRAGMSPATIATNATHNSAAANESASVGPSPKSIDHYPCTRERERSPDENSHCTN